jgi:hypothetical protein
MLRPVRIRRGFMLASGSHHYLITIIHQKLALINYYSKYSHKSSINLYIIILYRNKLHLPVFKVIIYLKGHILQDNKLL